MNASASVFASGMKYGGIYCCVFKCHNSKYRDASRGVKFFPFPHKDNDRFLRWCVAVNRKDNKGKFWLAKKCSRICSEHFYEGKASEDPLSPSYVPSIWLSSRIEGQWKIFEPLDDAAAKKISLIS